MTLADLKSIDLLQTRSIAEACNQEREGGGGNTGIYSAMP